VAILKIEGLTKHYRDKNSRLAVLNNINLDINDGEFVCIVGPSGCGKTTLLNIIAGLDTDYEGKVLYKGSPVTGAGPDRIMIFQELGLFPWLTAQKNVEFGLRFKNMRPHEKKEKALRFLEMVNLIKFKDNYIHQLSGGMKQRLALARALAIDPEILLMDEPFAALDAQTRDILHEELQDLWLKTKKTIIFVTHNVREAVCLGDRVAVFSSSPAYLKSSFDVNLPRPRHIENPGLMEIVRPILGDLKCEIEKHLKSEMDATLAKYFF
jgi:NitT/TauT family transport system ATP-binding protein